MFFLFSYGSARARLRRPRSRAFFFSSSLKLPRSVREDNGTLPSTSIPSARVMFIISRVRHYNTFSYFFFLFLRIFYILFLLFYCIKTVNENALRSVHYYKIIYFPPSITFILLYNIIILYYFRLSTRRFINKYYNIMYTRILYYANLLLYYALYGPF